MIAVVCVSESRDVCNVSVALSVGVDSTIQRAPADVGRVIDALRRLARVTTVWTSAFAHGALRVVESRARSDGAVVTDAWRSVFRSFVAAYSVESATCH
jgi:hypothetical protein